MASGSTRKFESKVAQIQGVGTDEGSHDYSSLDVGDVYAGSHCDPNNEVRIPNINTNDEPESSANNYQNEQQDPNA